MELLDSDPFSLGRKRKALAHETDGCLVHETSIANLDRAMEDPQSSPPPLHLTVRGKKSCFGWLEEPPD